jgi:hypothetical protein
MKKILFILLVPAIAFAFDMAVEYNFDYFYFYKVNYFSAHTLTGSISNENQYVKFYSQFYGRFYKGDAKYVITYPGIDLSNIGFVPPSYIQLKDDIDVSQLYISFFYNSFNVKIGKMPLKWGISEIYSPADIFSFNVPFNVYAIKTGVDAMSASYSLDNLTVSAIYQDGDSYEKTKQALSVEYLSPYMTGKLYSAHLFKEKVTLFDSDSIENVLIGLSLISDYTGPGIWAEGDLFIDERNKRLYLTLGADYTFFEKIYALSEGFVNFSGIDAPYPDNAHINKLLNSEFLMGKYYIFSNIILNRGEKFEAGVLSVFNLDDFSSIEGIALKYSPKSYFNFNLGLVGTTGTSREEFFRVPFISYFEISYSF